MCFLGYNRRGVFAFPWNGLAVTNTDIQKCILINGKKICLPLFSPSGLPVFPHYRSTAYGCLKSGSYQPASSTTSKVLPFQFPLLFLDTPWHSHSEQLCVCSCVSSCCAHWSSSILEPVHQIKKEHRHAREIVNCEAEALSLFLLISEWWVLQLSLTAGTLLFETSLNSDHDCPKAADYSDTSLHSTSNLHTSGKTQYTAQTPTGYILLASSQLLPKH